MLANPMRLMVVSQGVVFERLDWADGIDRGLRLPEREVDELRSLCGELPERGTRVPGDMGEI